MNLVNTVFVVIASVLSFAVTDGFMLVAPCFKVIVDIIFIGINLAFQDYVLLDKGFDSRLLNIRQHVNNNLATPLNHAQYRRLIFFKCATTWSAFEPPFSWWTLQIFLMLQGGPCDQQQCKPRQTQPPPQE